MDSYLQTILGSDRQSSSSRQNEKDFASLVRGVLLRVLLYTPLSALLDVNFLTRPVPLRRLLGVSRFMN